jgi:hypothetical protein
MALPTLVDPVVVASYIASGSRIARRRVRGMRRFEGDAAAICRASIDACWTGQYLAASGGHFRQAWTRDLGFAAPSLVRLGQRERVHASLAWMLDAWSRRGRVTTTVFPGGRPRDIWTLGVDSVPLLVHALRTAGAGELVARHGGWLGPEIGRYGAEVVDPATGRVRDDRVFSSHRDTVRTRSNAYAATMVALLDRDLRETDWFASPVLPGAVERLVEAHWRGDRFVDRADGAEVTGDATVAPFFFEVVPDALGLGGALAAARVAGLADPLPLRYSARRDAAVEGRVQRWFVADYQGSAIWTSLGAMYLRLLQRWDVSAARPEVAAYRRMVERDGTVVEVYAGGAGGSPDLRPYRGRFGLFLADEAMLWAAILLEAFEADDAGRPSVGVRPRSLPATDAGQAASLTGGPPH